MKKLEIIKRTIYSISPLPSLILYSTKTNNPNWFAQITHPTDDVGLGHRTTNYSEEEEQEQVPFFKFSNRPILEFYLSSLFCSYICKLNYKATAALASYSSSQALAQLLFSFQNR